MALLTNQFVKDNFIQYQSYFIDEAGEYQETVLTNEIELAEDDFLQYVNVDETSITDALKLHLLNFTKYRGFVRKHGDTEFDAKTQIVKDYEMSRNILEEIKKGDRNFQQADITPSDEIRMNAKTRKFGSADGSRNWFN